MKNYRKAIKQLKYSLEQSYGDSEIIEEDFVEIGLYGKNIQAIIYMAEMCDKLIDALEINNIWVKTLLDVSGLDPKNTKYDFKKDGLVSKTISIEDALNLKKEVLNELKGMK